MTLPNDAQGNGSLGDAALSPEQWVRVRALVEEALPLSREARLAFLEASCGGDDALRDRVERLADAYERADEKGFLEHPAGELAAPLLALSPELPHRRKLARTADLLARVSSALADRYRIERELGAGGMATVYLAHDVRHGRQVAIKVLHPELSAVLGAERFLSEIKTTAALQHPHILPLFDSGSADGLLFYVMPLVEGETLRARLTQEKQLPVADAVRIASEVAGALDYAHRRGVIHRDIKPENILLHEGRPLVADFGIALAVQSAGALRITQPGMSLGTPQYMSPEQSTGEQEITARSDIYALGAVTYEMLTGEPPFTGATVQQVVTRVRTEEPRPITGQRKHVPPHVQAAVLTALEKLPADRFESAGDFARALSDPVFRGTAAVGDGSRAPAAPWRDATRLALLAAAVVGLASASAAWIASRKPDAPTWFVHDDLIDQSIRSAATITPDGSTLVYTGSADAGRPIMLRPVGQLAARAVARTEQGYDPFVAPDGQRLAFWSSAADPGIPSDPRGKLTTVSIDGVAASDIAVSQILRRIFRKPKAWRYGNGAWVDDSVIVGEFGAPGLVQRVPGRDTLDAITRLDTARGEGGGKHVAPLLLPGARAVVFTVRRIGGPGLVTGQLAIASLGPGTTSPSPHVLLGLMARHAFAFVDGWLLYTSADGKAIMAVRLDVEHQRISGTPVSVLEDEEGNLETAALADNGTLLYVRRPRVNTLVFVDSSGAVRPGFASAAGSFMYPRISPDGKRFLVQVTADSRHDVWLYDIASRTPTQLTSTGRALHPTWTPDAHRVVFMTGRVLMSQSVDGVTPAAPIPGTESPFAPIVLRDGRSVLFMKRSGPGWRIWSSSLSGDGAPRRVMDDSIDNYMPAVSADGNWLAYVSRATGKEEVYVRPLPGPGSAVRVSEGGGIEPAWSRDGYRIYYISKGALMAVEVVTTPELAIASRRLLFEGAFHDHQMPHRNYDVAPDGTGFLTIAPPPKPAVVIGLNWLPELRSRLARER